jgi:hypothetical protein
MEQHVAAFEAHLIADREQVAELLVAEPVEQVHAAQIFDEHQLDLPNADRTATVGRETADSATSCASP